MFDEDDDDDYEFDDDDYEFDDDEYYFDDEDDELDYFEIEEMVKEMPLYKKGLEIQEVVNALAGLMPEEDEYLQFMKDEMVYDAGLLTVKIISAEMSELYDVKMEAATFIRKAARDLMVIHHSFEMFDFKEVEYFKIVRDLVEEYRLLFIDWVTGFDKWDYVIDRWGLFNPPGVTPFDKDPDEDIPWSEEDWF